MKNYNYNYIYIFGNFPSRPCNMLYLPLCFWGLQVILKRHEQKPAYTCRDVRVTKMGTLFKQPGFTNT